MKKFYLIILASLLMSCGVKEKYSSAKIASAEGGVDGSGGNLTSFEKGSLDQWLREEHPFLVKETINRLLFLQENSPQDFEFMEGLPEKFLGNDPAVIWDLVNSAKYFVKDQCFSTDHAGGRSDAAINEKGEICFSYSAFKNLSVHEMGLKLITMTMHELSHLRGFNEDSAEKWQTYFSASSRNKLGDLTVYFMNHDYLYFKKSLANYTTDIANAFVLTLNGKEQEDYGSCAYIQSATRKTIDIFQGDKFLPASMRLDWLENIIRPIVSIRGNCSKLSRPELARETNG